jgi:cold shock CspA family protein
VFVHASNIENTEPYAPIDDGHKVSFEIGENDKGLYAKNVTLL